MLLLRHLVLLLSLYAWPLELDLPPATVHDRRADAARRMVVAARHADSAAAAALAVEAAGRRSPRSHGRTGRERLVAAAAAVGWVAPRLATALSMAMGRREGGIAPAIASIGCSALAGPLSSFLDQEEGHGAMVFISVGSTIPDED